MIIEGRREDWTTECLCCWYHEYGIPKTKRIRLSFRSGFVDPNFHPLFSPQGNKGTEESSQTKEGDFQWQQESQRRRWPRRSKTQEVERERSTEIRFPLPYEVTTIRSKDVTGITKEVWDGCWNIIKNTFVWEEFGRVKLTR